MKSLLLKIKYNLLSADSTNLKENNLKAGLRLFSDSSRQRNVFGYCLLLSLLLNDQAVNSTSANKRDCSYCE